MTLDGEVALVTGAGSGIGATIARVLGGHGAAVVVNYRSSRRGAEDVVAAIEERGGRALAVGADVTDASDVLRLAKVSEAAFGTVGILVNNAGVTNERRPFGDVTWGDLSRQIDATLRSFLLCTQAFLPGMIDRKKGRVVAVGSIAANRPTAGSHAYVAAKSGLTGLARALAQEAGPAGVTVNVVDAGLVEGSRAERMTEEYRRRYVEHTALRRLGGPEDVANAVAFLVSDAAAYITGASLAVDGGFSLG